MISPVSHSKPVPQAESAASKQPKPAVSNPQNKTRPAQDKVTLSQKTGDVDRDGDTK